MRAWITGHAGGATVVEYQLPPMGTGVDPAGWPSVPGVVISPWWDASLYSSGLCWWQNKLWAAPKSGYDTNPPATTLLVARDGQSITVPLPRQRFAGFVKRGPGLEPYVGGGGYESGQGSASGPCFGTVAGQSILEWGWPALPGDAGWDARSPREPNYWPKDHVDSWVAWEPRTVNGVLEGRWASDRVYGGGLVLPEGITFWPWLGTGELDYAVQSETFAPEAMNRTYAYRYSGSGALLGYQLSADFVANKVSGQELDTSGRVYLCRTNAWASGSYQVDPAIFVYG